MDSKNVKRLDTNETVIKSKDGETYISGPVLEMRDKQATPVLRLKAGYDAALDQFVFFLKDVDGNLTFNVTDTGQLQLLGKPIIELYDGSNALRLRMGFDETTGKFVFELYNAAEVQTIGVDSNGDGTFTGSISGSTVTGGTIRTAESGARIQIDQSNGFVQYDAGGVRRLQIDASNFGYIALFDSSGNLIGHLSANTGAVTLYGQDTIPVQIGTHGSNSNLAIGGWKFVGDKIGFFNSPPTSKVPVSNLTSATASATYGTTEQTMLQNVYDKVNELIATLNDYGLV